MADKHTSMGAKPRSLRIEALAHGGYVVHDDADECRGPFRPAILAAFTRLTDAVSWIEEQLRLPEAECSKACRG